MTVLLVVTVHLLLPPPPGRVLFVGIDGTRPDALRIADAPHLHGLRSAGAYSDRAQTGDITVSGPGWSSMLTGVWREKHGVRDNEFAGHNLREWPTFLERAQAHAPWWRTASFATWKPVHTFILKSATLKSDHRADQSATDAAARELGHPHAAVVFVNLDEVDVAGHKFGFSPTVPEYLAAIADADRSVGQLLVACRARPRFAEENWLVVVTTDHGGTGKSHGRNIPPHRTIFTILAGPGVTPGEIQPPPGVVDCAVTALAHLGVPTKNVAFDGKPVSLLRVNNRR